MRIAGTIATCLVTVTAMICLGGCTIVSELATPDESRTVVIPGTDVLTTESSVGATSIDPSAAEERDSSSGYWDDLSYGHIINVAPRANSDAYHRGAKTPQSPLAESSGFHFSSPDRAVLCSTGASGTGTLACTSDRIDGAPAPPRGTPATCQWNPHLATLGPAGAAAGGCADLFPVLSRSTILPFGRTLAAGRFKCLNTVDGVFCLQSGDTGFAITKDGYRAIRPDERAPRTAGGSGAEDGTSTTPSVPPTS
ncbi:MAG: hypothetical protein QM728_10530 [Gordonia sp. (in: high G+C Gram-positive bacteria)]|uniref:hypothetical protein n=1 Tax=Gordonia sp. (in: high G+C Gram-positive bacteria) TaxID=84139 RepID=UPI0039E66361